MPTINRLPKKVKRARPQNDDTEARQMRRKAYNRTDWRKIRDTYIKTHPLCEKCLKKGLVVASEDVHHIKSPFKGKEVNYNLLLDPDNLEALCKQCHADEHVHRNNPKPEDVLKALDDFFNDIPDDDDNQ